MQTHNVSTASLGNLANKQQQQQQQQKKKSQLFT
jgi:hypothetical protein